jgi:hypothetical protein
MNMIAGFLVAPGPAQAREQRAPWPPATESQDRLHAPLCVHERPGLHLAISHQDPFQLRCRTKLASVSFGTSGGT